MEDYNNIPQTSNINEKWLENIYENIKKTEELERLVREGCSSLLDYMNIPVSMRPVIVGTTQFKNLRFLITEFKLLLADVSPVLYNETTKEDGTAKFREFLDNVTKALENKSLFIKSSYDINGKLINTHITPFFNQTIEAFYSFKLELFKEIKHILYIENRREW